ncbi:MAG: TolC family protein, partial [Desulfovibrio sp.]|nr:TolC family protein [Desulfovibrio sp.]
QEQYQHYSKAVEFNKYTKEAYLEQFSIGKRSLLDVLDTISELYNSSTQAETARGNILVGAYRLSGLTGKLLPSMGIDTRPLEKRVPVDPTDKKELFAPAWFK